MQKQDTKYSLKVPINTTKFKPLISMSHPSLLDPYSSVPTKQKTSQPVHHLVLTILHAYHVNRGSCSTREFVMKRWMAV